MRDIDIRRALRTEKRLHYGEPDTRVVEELGLCQGIARVDIAVVNGSIHGYEIKSEHDTLARLAGQIEIYNQALDFVTIVTAPAHGDKVIVGTVPNWWGVWIAELVDGRTRFDVVREARKNKDVVPFAMAQLLWRAEALLALEERSLAEGVRSRPRKELWYRLVSELPFEELSAIVRETLKLRGSTWRSGELPV